MNKNITLHELLSSPVEEYFSDYTIRKSAKYLLGVRITDFHEVDDKFIMASINGTKKYLVSMSVVDNKLSFKCSCPVEGLCKHEAALYQFTQSKLNIKVLSDDDIKNITDEIIYQDIKKALNGRSYLSSYNIDKFQEALNPYRTILSQYIDNNDIKKYFILFIKLLKALSRYMLNNQNLPEFNMLVEDLFSDSWLTIYNNFDIFTENYNNLEKLDRITYFDYLFNVCINSKVKKNNKVLRFFEKELEYLPIYISQAKQEELREKIYLYKIINEFDNKDYKNISEIRKRLNMPEYRSIYVNYLIENKNTNELEQIFYKYNNYKASHKSLLMTYIKYFKNENRYNVLKDVICSLISSCDMKESEIEKIIDDNYSVLDDDFIIKLGLDLYLSDYSAKINALYRKYNELHIFYLALNTFTKFDENFEIYKEKYAVVMKAIYYNKVMTLFREDYLLSGITKKKIMRYINRLHSLPNGDYYVFDIYEFFKTNRYRGIFPELDKYCGSLDL